MEGLTQKERLLLQDQKKHEQLCVKKYTDYTNQASDPQLKQVFSTIAQQEKQHLDTVNQILEGQMPSTSGQQNNQSNQSGKQQNQFNVASGSYNKNDADLCSDLLMTEKFVSGSYDTAIFEFKNSNIRQTLNHIQKEEQQHGEDIYNYMASHDMY